MKKKIQLTTEIEVFETFSDLPLQFQNLMKAAEQISEKAYAPYSNFQVGAALQLENGEIVTGSNQENAAYPSGICAERSAIYWTGSNYPDQKITAIAVVGKPKDAQDFVATAPCGACRQAMFEYEMKQESPIPLLMIWENGEYYLFPSLGSLLPLHFDKSALTNK
ncbi:cytidine deaminase [Sediminitomix flava]|uniref:Cytidine deaminase n=1 Tax=Sediminitomix flava TaxID=379075 RepID=A0A315YX97_SEDFL|nr:cytidine deaminase [Sediminitomix flava]PWJ34196.1 cytidine deaminase [Sediminitomix flava]